MEQSWSLGKWYTLEKPGCVCANGKQYHASMRLGTDNNLIFFFDGGGLSWSEYTAARPISPEGDPNEGYYGVELGTILDLQNRPGITMMEPWNHFKNWNYFIAHYGTGDIQIGDNDYCYTSLKQEPRVLHHSGYRNFQFVLENAKMHCPNPEKILVAGGSAGALSAAALAEEIVLAFPNCKEIYFCLDGGLGYADWKTIARNVWNASPQIIDKLRSNNLVVDCLTDLNQKYGERVRCLLISSARDAVLAWFQKALNGEKPAYTKEAGVQFQELLTQTCIALMEQDPNIGIYIYDYPYEGTDPEMELTQHTILTNSNMSRNESNRSSVSQWLWDCVKGNVTQVGLDLLL